MKIIKTLIKIGVGGGIVAALTGGVLYAFGLRYVMDGSGFPHFVFVESASTQAARVERHREAQRAEAPKTEAAVPLPTPDAPIANAAAAGLTARPSENTAAAYWTDFRGPKRDGDYREGPLRLDWPAAGLKPIWKQPSGGGYASFVIARNRAFTIEQRGAQEVVAAYDVPTGRELWTNAWAAEFRESMGGDGPRATPTWAGGVVYALGATGELRALDEASGTTIWRTNILADSGADNLSWGMSAAPLLVGNAVVVLPGGPRDQAVVAYERSSGKRLWSLGGGAAAYSSPMLVTLDGVPQIVAIMATRVVGLSADGAKELWSYDWAAFNGINAAQPIVLGENRLFVSSGYGMGAAVIELTNGSTVVREIWRNTRMKNRFSSSVLLDGTIYGLDEGILAAIDANTGDQKWKGGRYGHGQVLLAGDRLIVLTEDGDLALVHANPSRHEEITRFHVLDGKTWNVPAIGGGYLLVRNLAEMAAFDLRVAR